jgi:ABC-2 type transport system ATP-binding protein
VIKSADAERMDDMALSVRGLTKRFGDRTVVDGVDLEVPRGCSFGYLGPNGAGKTTLIRMVLGLTAATSGSMTVLGYPVPAFRSVALSRVGAIVDEPRFHGYLTGRQNLDLLAAARQREAHHRIDPSLELVGLRDRAGDRVGTYSMGMRQRLGVAACLLGDPELLLLDEPMNGLDPGGMVDLRLLIRHLVGEGRTVVLSSHLLDEVEKTCDEIAVVDRGRVVAQGSIAEVIGGATRTLHIGCDDPILARQILLADRVADSVKIESDGVSLSIPSGGDEVAWRAAGWFNRILVEQGITVYSLDTMTKTLESRFLEITSALGGQS